MSFIFIPSLFQYVAYSARLPIGIIVLGLCLNLLLRLVIGRIRWGLPLRLAKHSNFTLFLIILGLGALIGLFFKEDLFSGYILSLDGLTLLVPCLFLLGVIALIKRLSGRKVGRAVTLASVVGMAAVFSLILLVSILGGLNAWEVASTESYVARAVPILDQIRARNGQYPRELPVSQLGEPPYLLKDYGDYFSNGSGFRFEYLNEPAGWAGGEGLVVFDDSDRKWEEDR